jgi:hypothetical protein
VSVIDKWLNIHRRDGGVATFATSATNPQDALVSAASNVATPLRQIATFPTQADLSQPCRNGFATSKPAETQASPGFVADVADVAGVPKRETSARVDWAEGLARLHPDRPPGDVPTKRWLRFVDDVGLFLDGPFCATAAALGWGPLDLFGCDRDRPFARLDQAGLLWLLNGSRFVALSENTATIKRPAGALQTYRRKPNGPGQALPWELAMKGETPP